MTRTALVSIGHRQWQVAIAESYSELTNGLRSISLLSTGTGMLFSLPHNQSVSVTTQEMSFPIDIIFISAEYTVVKVAANVFPEKVVSCGVPVRYFLEVAAGEGEGISHGDTVGITVFQNDSENDWIYPVLSIAGVIVIGAFFAKAGTSMMKALSNDPMVELGNGVTLQTWAIIPETIDVRGKSLEEVYRIIRRYPPARYREIGVQYPHQTKRIDIDRFSERARNSGAVVIVIQEFGQTAFIPINSGNKPIENFTSQRNHVDLFPDSPEYLAYTIDDIGYRTTIDNAFLRAIARAKGGR